MSKRTRGGALRVVAASVVTTLTLGSIHAFSVLGAALEPHYGAGRAEVSSIYSLALVALTAAVLLSPRLYARVRPVVLLAAAFVMSIAGIVISLSAGALWQVTVGYGLVFGAANGVGYGLALTMAATAMPARKGAVMCVVTASYALGAAVVSPLLGAAIGAHGLSGGLAALLATIAIGGGVAVALATLGGARVPAGEAAGGSRGAAALTAVLWVAYGTAVFSGLMAIGHAAGIAQAQGAGVAQFATAAALIAAGNALGGLACASIADRWPMQRLLALLPACSLAGLAVLRWVPGIEAALTGLAVVGFGYGAIIATYPPAIARLVGLGAYARTYGRVFTAWGVAGLFGPWLAGRLYETSGDYHLALEAAAALAIVSMLAVLCARGMLAGGAREP